MRLARHALPLVSIALAACGARSTLVSSTGATGGAPSTTTSPSATGGASGACTAWQLVEPVVALPTPAPAARAPEMSLADNDQDVYLTIIEAPQGAAGVLRSGRLRALGMWPPDFVGMVEADTDVRDYVTGEGATGPVALVANTGGQLQLATTLLPQVVAMPQQTPGNVPLFVAGLAERWIFGASQVVTNFTKLDVGSYQTGSLEQVEEPSACLASTVLGAVVPAGQGFVGAYALPNPPSDACDVMSPKAATVTTFYRYESPTEPGSFLVSTEGDHLVFGEPLAKLVLSATTDGAWAFTQSDGSTAELPPAVLATRVDGNGHIEPVGATSIVVAPDGSATGPIAATSLGDGAVFAWVDAADPSAPTISVRSLAPGGDLGAVTTFATSPVFLTGRLRVLASRNLRSLVVAWEGGSVGATVGLARLDCAPSG